jgi:hypothetical protein
MRHQGHFRLTIRRSSRVYRVYRVLEEALRDMQELVGVIVRLATVRESRNKRLKIND